MTFFNVQALAMALAVFCVCGGVAHGANAPATVPFRPGETIVYDIKKLKLKWGTATIVFHGPRTLEGKPVLLITFTGKGVRFLDEEKIYVEPATFLPVRVERNLDIFGKKERIMEYYDAAKGTVRIVKTAGGRTTEQTIRTSPPLDNIYCFIFRYRALGHFTPGEKIQLHLPTRDVQFLVDGKQPLAMNDEELNAYYMESDPTKYRVWFDTGQRKIPLRIDGAVGFGKTAMIMKKYIP